MVQDSKFFRNTFQLMNCSSRQYKYNKFIEHVQKTASLHGRDAPASKEQPGFVPLTQAIQQPFRLVSTRRIAFMVTHIVADERFLGAFAKIRDAYRLAPGNETIREKCDQQVCEENKYCRGNACLYAWRERVTARKTETRPSVLALAFTRLVGRIHRPESGQKTCWGGGISPVGLKLGMLPPDQVAFSTPSSTSSSVPTWKQESHCKFSFPYPLRVLSSSPVPLGDAIPSRSSTLATTFFLALDDFDTIYHKAWRRYPIFSDLVFLEKTSLFYWRVDSLLLARPEECVAGFVASGRPHSVTRNLVRKKQLTLNRTVSIRAAVDVWCDPFLL